MTLPSMTDPFVLLDDSQQQADGEKYLFHSPERIICARTLDEARLAFVDIDAAVADGFHVAGWVAYECAAVFEPRIESVVTALPDEPLIWMMVTRCRDVLNEDEAEQWLDAAEGIEPGRMSFAQTQVDEDAYVKTIASIKDYINAGDVYQVNYTFARALHHGGSLPSLYKRLRTEQPVAYGAFINTGQETIMSLSPELFIKRTGNLLEAKPMKGTAARGGNKHEDAMVAEQLASDIKSRAENLMIVDLIRNDLSRIAKPGTVAASNLFAVEAFPSLHQMTSTVQAECDEEMTPSTLFAALFPCGSVTGAPKIRAMEIIAELEADPRGVYCGAIGHFSPELEKEPINWCFNVPIRTISMRSGSNFKANDPAVGRFAVGSGVVADSDAKAEYAECLLKARFAETVAEQAPFQLIETMRVEGGGIPMLSLHMDRLVKSANELAFICDRKHVQAEIQAHLNGNITEFRTQDILRMRLVLGPDGKSVLSSCLLNTESKLDALRVCFADETIGAADSLRRHKTTLRSVYDRATSWARKNDYADVLFVNEHGHVAEGAISNVFIESADVLYTPPISSGALPGVLRAQLLTDKSCDVRQKTLTPDDVLNADRVYLGNALRGLRAVDVAPLPAKII